MSSKKSTQPLKHGNEPTDLLLGLMSAQLETLIDRKVVSLLTANTPDGQPAVVLVIANTQWIDGILVLASVGSQEEIANTQAEVLATPVESVGNPGA